MHCSVGYKKSSPFSKNCPHSKTVRAVSKEGSESPSKIEFSMTLLVKADKAVLSSFLGSSVHIVLKVRSCLSKSAKRLSAARRSSFNLRSVS